jgi:hypothetical protein
MIDLDRMTNDPEFEHYAYRPRVPPHARAHVWAWAIILVIIGLIGFAAGMSVHSAKADGVATCSFLPGEGACVWHDGIDGGLGKVIQVPQPESEADKAAAAERERQWVARCHPLTWPDKFGVARYHYGAPNCEFGR